MLTNRREWVARMHLPKPKSDATFKSFVFFGDVMPQNIILTVAALSTIVLSGYPASAANMLKRNAGQACYNVVMAAHPDIKGKARGDEIRKCKVDPEAYNKALGL